ncbi:EAL domain-containing protein [Cellulomonas sp. ATA003]|uniref:putative bifunctional diguanylate cyclase/phosphodiesterase n=1 Tax=Cellulomonas sp. ATA003 TaxID=3073064 RepID=UPI002872FB56|nr:EAL domain-containing protein [Cellulomonas sp. ATA003]WNB87085.1 EAL domain-containing protein [Cellulomonas sp. ATA003]
MFTAAEVRDAVGHPDRVSAVEALERDLAALRREMAPLARLAAAVSGAAVGAVTLVTPGRVLVVTSVDPAREVEHTVPDEVSACAHVVTAGHPLHVSDCRAVGRLAAHPSVVAGRTRFYAGAPLLSPDGVVLGAVCVSDPEPRGVADDALLAALADLADQASGHLRHRRHRLEQQAQRDVLEAVASGAPLTDVLDRLARNVERVVAPGLLCSVLLLDDDGVTLRDGAAPSLPAAYRAAIDGLRAGEGVGSCGTAVHRREEVVVTDIASDPKWVAFRDLAREHGLTSCVSSPVIGSDGTVLGTFAVYRRGPGQHVHEGDRVSLAAFRDLTRVAIERHRSRVALTRLATRDTVTGLHNRAAFLDAAARVLAESAGPGRTHAVLFCDLDRFKMVNDSLGHAAGDDVLVAVADALRSAVPPGAVVCRFAGDAFTVVLADVAPDDAVAVADHAARLTATPLRIPGHTVELSMSIGLATTTLSGTDDLNALLRDADLAMHDAKQAGRARVRVCDATLQAAAATELETSLALRRAIGTDELTLTFQPEVDARTGGVIGFEALLRWTRPGLGPVPPAHFVPIAERTGLIVELGADVLLGACRQLAEWRERHPAARTLTLWVNVSAHQLAAPGFVRTVTDALAATGVPGAAVGLEVTESAVMADPDAARATLTSIRALGVRIALDDFGTGYSSLSMLKTLPVDVLKIDRSFISGLGEDPSDTRIVAAVISMAQALGLTVVAEGVETQRQRDELQTLGCEAAQGYLFGRPAPAAHVGSVLTAMGSLPRPRPPLRPAPVAALGR